METHENIKALREKQGLSQEALAQRTGYRDRSSIAKIEAGLVDLTQSKIAAFAKALNVTPANLMGIGEEVCLHDDAQLSLPSNVVPLPDMKKVPLVGQIACGTPILAEQNIEEYIDLPAHITADYALTCKGESMINIGIEDGDIVYIRQQDEVENGQVAAVMVGDDEATLKRFYYEDGIVQLIAENSAIPPKIFVGEAISQVRIIGRAMAYTHVIE